MFSLKSILNFFKPALPVVEATAKELAKIALAAVAAEAPKVITGQEKFNSALNTVTKTLSASGKSAAVSLIAVAIEAAYAGLNSK